MWLKLYISIIIVFLIYLLQRISIAINSLDQTYSIQEKYGAPIKCFSSTICGMTGNIFFLWIIYLIIPEEFYDNLFEILDVRSLYKTANKYNPNINIF